MKTKRTILDHSSMILLRMAAVSTLLLVLAGCRAQDKAEVTGTVSLDGEPIKLGNITFTPADGKTSVEGAQIQDGRYSAKVPIGLMKVEISVPKVVGTKPLYPHDPKSPVMEVKEELLPGKYNSSTELELEVKAGRNEKDWVLSTK